MLTLSSLARPYALAAFEYARDKHQLPAWKIFLETGSICVNAQGMDRLLNNPKLSADTLFHFFYDILAPRLDEEQKNFLLLLAHNKRLALLPDISAIFNAYFAALEKISHVRVITAIETQESFRQQLADALNKRIQGDVQLKYETDPSIIGGAVIHIGDKVIDGSVLGRLTRLLNDLTS